MGGLFVFILNFYFNSQHWFFYFFACCPPTIVVSVQLEKEDIHEWDDALLTSLHGLSPSDLFVYPVSTSFLWFAFAPPQCFTVASNSHVMSDNFGVPQCPCFCPFRHCRIGSLRFLFPEMYYFLTPTQVFCTPPITEEGVRLLYQILELWGGSVIRSLLIFLRARYAFTKEKGNAPLLGFLCMDVGGIVCVCVK